MAHVVNNLDSCLQHLKLGSNIKTWQVNSQQMLLSLYLLWMFGSDPKHVEINLYLLYYDRLCTGLSSAVGLIK